jgi:hypothetical protein
MLTAQYVIEQGTISTGIVYVEDESIFYKTQSGKIYKIRIADIAIIGEYTLNNNPLNKNAWHIVFVDNDGRWFTIPWLTQQMQQLAEYLAYQFNISFPIEELPKTIRCKSLIRYPEILKKKELFSFTPPPDYKLPLNTWQKIMNLFRIGRYRRKWKMKLTNEVKVFLNS